MSVRNRVALVVAVVAASALSLAAASCKKGGGASAVAYNDQFVDMQTKIARSMMDLVGTFDSGTPEERERLHAATVATVADALAKARAVPPFEGNAELRDSVVALFEFYDGAVKKEYRELIDVFKKDEMVEADVTRLNELTESVAAREAAADARFQAAQRAFASKYGFIVAENPLQNEIDKLGTQ